MKKIQCSLMCNLYIMYVLLLQQLREIFKQFFKQTNKNVMSNSGNCTVFETPPSPPIQINFFSLYYLILTYFPKKYLFTLLLHTIVLVLHTIPHIFCTHIFFCCCTFIFNCYTIAFFCFCFTYFLYNFFPLSFMNKGTVFSLLFLFLFDFFSVLYW